MSMDSPSAAAVKYQALIQLLRTAEDLWNASRAFFAPWDLSPSQFNVLNVLYGHPDGLSQSDLSRVLIMHRSNVTGLIDRLERRELVQRTAHDTDRRAYRLFLTPAGLELIQRILPVYHRASEAVWADLDAQEAGTLLVQLQSLAGNALAVAHLNAAAISTRAPRPSSQTSDSAPDSRASALLEHPSMSGFVSAPPVRRPRRPGRPARSPAPPPPPSADAPPSEPPPPRPEDTLRTSDL